MKSGGGGAPAPGAPLLQIEIYTILAKSLERSKKENIFLDFTVYFSFSDFTLLQHNISIHLHNFLKKQGN